LTKVVLWDVFVENLGERPIVSVHDAGGKLAHTRWNGTVVLTRIPMR